MPLGVLALQNMRLSRQSSRPGFAIAILELGMQVEPPTKNDLPTYSDDGVDLTLIRWMLSLTPAERLDVLQRNVESILRIRANRAEG